jgi:hypothetical protein
VVARLLSVGIWAMILSIILGGQMVEVVVSWVAGLGTVLRSLAGGLSDGQRRKEILLGLYLREEFGLGLDLALGSGQSSTARLLGGPNGSVKAREKWLDIDKAFAGDGYF